MRHQVVKGQRDRAREKRKLWDSSWTLGTTGPVIRALFLTSLHACPAAAAATLPGTVGLSEVSAEKEWKEDFKNGFFFYSFWPLGVLFLASLTGIGLFLESFCLHNWVFPYFELPLNPRCVIADGKNTEHKRKPIGALVLLWILVSFLSSSTALAVQRSVPWSLSRCDGIQWKDGTLPLSCLEMEPFLFWKDQKYIIMFL